MLISLLIAVVVCGLVIYLLGLLPLPEPWRLIVRCIVILCLVVYLLEFIAPTSGRSLLMFVVGGDIEKSIR
jgi:hypothetical protein